MIEFECYCDEVYCRVWFLLSPPLANVHIDIKSWTPHTYRDLLTDWDDIKRELKLRGIERISGLFEENPRNAALPRLARLFGFSNPKQVMLVECDI